MQIIVDNIDVLNPLEGKMDVIIDCFAEVYGEKYRQKIKENLENIKCVFVPRELSHKPLSDVVSDYYKGKRHKIEQDLYSPFTMDNKRCQVLNTISHEDILNLKNGIDFDSDKLMTYKLNTILQFLGILKSKDDVIKHEMKVFNIREDSKEHWDLIETSVGEELSRNELEKLLQKDDVKQTLKAFVNNVQREYNMQNFEARFLQLEIDKAKALKQVEPLDNEQFEILKTCEQDLDRFFFRRMADIKHVNPLELDNKTGKKMAELYHDLLLLSDEDRCIYSKLSDHAKKGFVKLFRYLGYEYGDEYEEYISKLDVRSEVFPEELILDLKDLKRQQRAYKISRTKIFNKALDTIKEIEPEYGTLELVSATYDFIKNSNHDNTSAMITPCINKTTKKITSLLLCPWALVDQDSTIIHELGHIAELSLVDMLGAKSIVKTGFEVLKLPRKGIDYTNAYLDYIVDCADVNDMDYENLDDDEEVIVIDPMRKYELVSEVIHEYLILEVCDRLHQKGITLTLEDQIEESTASYADAFGLLGDFIEEHKQELIDARMSDDPDAIYKVIGKKNFDKIARETYEYWKKSSSNFEKFSKFGLELDEVMTENDLESIDEALELDHNWSKDSLEFIYHHKAINQIRNTLNQKQAKKDSNKDGRSQ